MKEIILDKDNKELNEYSPENYMSFHRYKNNQVTLGSYIVAILICIFAAYLSIDIILESRKIYTFTATLPANKSGEIVYLDTTIRPIENLVKIKLVDVNSITSSMNLDMVIRLQNDNISPTWYKIKNNENLECFLKAGLYYDIGFCLNENVEKDVELKIKVKGIYEP